MSRSGRSPIYVLALGLAMLIGSPPAGHAAEQAGVTLWQARWQYVRLVPQDGGSPNRHPANLSKAEIRSGLAQLKLDMGGEDKVDLLTPEERVFCADQLAKALARATPDQDVTLSTVGMRKTFIGLSEPKLTTIRAFMAEDGLNLIIGEAQVDPPNDTGTYQKADPRLVSFTDGRRAAPAKANAGWKIIAGGPGLQVKRADWVAVAATAMAVPELGSEEAQKQAQTKLDDVQRQMQQMQQQIQQVQKAPPAATPTAASPAQAAPVSVEDRLRSLDQLKAKGLVTHKEYAAKRKQILDSL